MKKIFILILLVFALVGCKQNSSAKVDVQDSNPYSGEVQEVRSRFTYRSYAPVTVKAGVPVRWIIEIDKRDLNGCNNAIIIPKYNIRKNLMPGENIVEFTPDSAGVVVYSCWMGMIRSKIVVVD